LPPNLTDYYPDNYYGGTPTLGELAASAEAERYKIDIVRQFIAKGRLLEIGPALGGFAYLAKTAGFDVEVVELDARCCAFLSEVVGIRAIHSHDECGALTEVKPVDVVALWQVIEHLQDPWSMLEAAVHKLLPGGILVIAAPNPAALQFRILGRLWAHVDAPRHVNLIPEALLVNVASTLGMVPVLRTTTDAGSLHWNRFGWEASLSNACAGVRSKRMGGKMGRLIARALTRLERRQGLGSAYTMVFHKPEA
jgi:2-polyprenyl-3-methyl-5-hydroxy-6-metoxy-1,4-benzoquinol methylase